ncbi:MAG: OsmC family protein [Pseudomonadota bacterium]|nr:OsmC family protein [Pseudomonadota bacterium]
MTDQMRNEQAQAGANEGTVNGIHIEELESELEGDIDLRGFLGLSGDVPKGFTNIRVNFRVRADVDNMERLKRLTAYSPVLNTITQGAKVDIRVEAK